MKTCGRFTLDDNDMLSGPGDYMREQGNTLVDAICKGNDAIFNMTSHYSPDIETAVLVRLQTDYAGWIGAKQILDMCSKRS